MSLPINCQYLTARDSLLGTCIATSCKKSAPRQPLLWAHGPGFATLLSGWFHLSRVCTWKNLLGHKLTPQFWCSEYSTSPLTSKEFNTSSFCSVHLATLMLETAGWRLRPMQDRANTGTAITTRPHEGCQQQVPTSLPLAGIPTPRAVTSSTSLQKHHWDNKIHCPCWNQDLVSITNPGEGLQLGALTTFLAVSAHIVQQACAPFASASMHLIHSHYHRTSGTESFKNRNSIKPRDVLLYETAAETACTWPCRLPL